MVNIFSNFNKAERPKLTLFIIFQFNYYAVLGISLKASWLC